MAACSVACGVAFALAGSALAQTFDLIEPPVGNAVRVYGLSADGSTAVGHSNTQSRSFTWTRAGGRQDLPAGTGQATAISGDASTIVGLPAFRYRGPGTYQPLGSVGNLPDSWAQGVSGDGGVVAGVAFATGGPGVAWRWTPGGGMQALGYARPTDDYSEAKAVSRDGGTIVGWSSGGGTSVAFRWTAAGGMTTLPSIPGSTSDLAMAVSRDGNLIAGSSGFAVIWGPAGVTPLPQLAGWGNMFPHGISDDGSVVAGEARNPSFQTEAWVWTQSRGSESLMSYLLSQGVQIPAGWNLVQTFAMSADGRTFGGYALNGAGNIGAGFVATVPTPGAYIAVCAAFLVTSKRKRRAAAT
jgi:uncharacterized membrane protein